MYPKQKTTADTRWEEALNEVRAAAPGLRAVVHRADAVAAKTDEEGPCRGIERNGIRAVDLIAAISGLSE